MCYTVTMIKGFRDKWLQDFFIRDMGSRRIPASIRTRLFRKLQFIDDATCDLDLRSPPSNLFERLRGQLKGTCSIRVNDQYRLLFTWNNERGEADGIYLDAHSYRK